MGKDDLERFRGFLEVNLRLAPRTVRDTLGIVGRFLESSDWIVDSSTISSYLRRYLSKASKTYNSQITALRRLVVGYLGREDLIRSFRLAPVDEVKERVVPSIEQVRRGFEVLDSPRDRALFLFYATTGLRRSEVLSLTRDQIDWKTRAVKPKHYTRSKRSGVTFFNGEAEAWLRRYLEERRDEDPRLFPISDRQFKALWRRVSQAAGIRITPQVLRVWFSSELGERGVPDRYIDIYQGRAPRSILAKHYTGAGLEGLKRIYDSANLSILSPASEAIEASGGGLNPEKGEG